MSPNLFLVGQPRSGTTSLDRWLSGQSQVYMSPVKEPNYFAPDLRSANDFNRRASYLKLFDGAHAYPWRGESSVCYLYSSEAAERIASFCVSARIVMSIREPVDFMMSVFHKRRANPRGSCETASTLERALALESQRRRGLALPRGIESPAMLLYRERADYPPQVERFLDRFPREQIFFTGFEDLKENPTAELDRLGTFLGLGRVAGDLPQVNASVNVRSRRVLDMVRAVEHGTCRMGQVKRIGKALLPTGLRHRAKAIVYASIQSGPKVDIPERVRHRLKAELRESVVRLSELLNYDFVTRWGY